MLNKKFASIRATANVKTEKRSSVASSTMTTSLNQRLSQSQSMEMYGINYHHQQQQQQHHHHQQQQNNESLMKESLRSTNLSPAAVAQYDQRTLLSPASPQLRSSIILKSTAHPYVNLMHQQYTSSPTHPHLQYQNNSNNSSTLSFGSPIILDASTTPNQSWNSLNSTPTTPLVTHYTASQIYMRPKNLMQQQHSPQHQQSSPMATHKKQPPEVPKRMTSTVSTGSLKKSNGLSRSGNERIEKYFKNDDL